MCINLWLTCYCVVSWAGLLHDREWLLKSLSGEILTQKKVQYLYIHVLLHFLIHLSMLELLVVAQVDRTDRWSAKISFSDNPGQDYLNITPKGVQLSQRIELFDLEGLLFTEHSSIHMHMSERKSLLLLIPNPLWHYVTQIICILSRVFLWEIIMLWTCYLHRSSTG